MYISPQSIRRLQQVHGVLSRLNPEAEPEARTLPGRMQPQANVIVLTGSFNPPTTAHIALLKEAQLYARAHQPMYLYAAISKKIVNKEHVERPLLIDRIILLEDVLRRRIPHAGLLLFNRGLYVEQAQALRRSFPHVQKIYFLMGFDKILQILDPRYYEDRNEALQALFQQAELLVAPRGSASHNDLTALLQQTENQPYARYIHALPFGPQYREVSSTHVRKDEYLYGDNTLQEVRAFMRHTRAYKPPLLLPDGTELNEYENRVKYLTQLFAPKNEMSET
ncbi:hypothetical protein [Tengunoibacter tsumagoiensis]|uniref:Cytidyltransferase-like domain-containing protein n=1 Tax=Tengunoibacter tsumagoiensis TaxID=2014871 RepID=A0A402A417_9CHLR|nr:hypothetical protein [Tengunoibacter tsumagoiensis]GCE13751.1 hypothetical protein KTT_36100 [Tengunoibacter tsumagoiensis]